MGKDLEVCLLGLVVVRSKPELLLRMECLWAALMVSMKGLLVLVLVDALLSFMGFRMNVFGLLPGIFFRLWVTIKGSGSLGNRVAYRRRIFVTSLIEGWPRPHGGIGFCLIECGICLFLFLTILLFCLQHPLCMVLSSLISHRVSALNLGGLARRTKRQQTYMGLKRRLDELNA
ncbi:hypothetical protein J1N35_029866 [Gossypium stocksii]|uniref:Transmembrane protein n=1 Tax=Gossypium stocksii TaxID=47602 RepID=A0A9D3V0V1_9ROSI|nr:hypothetical protein J1N35_029866 [Gossypium stocksii]